MSLNPLNHHYSMENPASVYDEEAMTALKLAGRTTAKVNETVQAFNELETHTNDHLDQQDQTIEERMTAQDNRITKMNNETMPNKVVSEFQKNLDNGTFEGMVNEYTGNLEARVNNLLGTIQVGTTTMDAEIIDMRTGADNETYTSAGSAIRSQLNNKVGVMVNMLDKSAITIGSYTWSDGSTVTNPDTYSTDYIPVRYGTWYINPAYNAAVSLYNADKTFVRAIWSDKGVFTIPQMAGENLVYFRVYGQLNRLYNDMVVFGGWPKSYREYNKPFIDPELSKESIYYDYVEYAEVYRNMLDLNSAVRGQYFDGEWHTKETLYQTGLIPYKPGTWYFNTGDSPRFTFYDENREYIQGSGITGVNGVITLPNNITYKYFSFYGLMRNINTDMVVHGYRPSTYHAYNEPFLNPEFIQPAEYGGQLQGKKILFVGDSRTWYDGNPYGERTKPELVGTTCTGYQQTVRELTGCTYANEGYSGYTSVDLCEKILTMDMSGYDMVVLAGGVNDYIVGGNSTGTLQPIGGAFNANTVYGAWQTAVEHILTNYPDLKIIMVTPVPCWNDGNKLPATYAQAKKDVANRYGLACCDLYNVSQINELNREHFFCDDATKTGWHLHLNNEGNSWVGKILGNFIMSV